MVANLWWYTILSFHRLEEALGHRVVPTVALAAHTLLHRHSLQLLLEGTAGVLHASVRVKQKGVEYRPVSHGHLEGSHRSYLRLHRLAQGPAHYFSIGQVQYHGQLQPAFPSSDVGQIRYPLLCRPYCLEIPCQMVVRYSIGMTGVGSSHPILLSYNTLYMMILHKTGYPWAGGSNAPLLQFKTYPGTAIAALALLIYFLDLLH